MEVGGGHFSMQLPCRRRIRLRQGVLPLILITLLTVPSAGAATYPITIPFGRSWPYSIVIDSSRGIAFFDASSGDYPPTGFLFGVLNLTSHSVMRTLPLNVVPGPMALDEATGEVFVAGGGSIEVFNSTGSVGMLKTPGLQIVDMTFDSAVSPYIFFTSGNGVFALDPADPGLVKNVTLPEGPGSVLLDPANGLLYVSEYLSGQIAVLDASTMAPRATVRLPSCCASQMALDSKTQTIYASTGTNLVDVVNAATNEFERNVKVAPSSLNSTGPIAVDDLSGRAYVVSSPGGTIVEIDGSNGAVLRHLEVQSQAAGLAVDSGAHELYATNYHQITVFDTGGARSYRLLIGLAAVVGGVGVLAVYLLLRRKDERERARVQSWVPGDPAVK